MNNEQLGLKINFEMFNFRKQARNSIEAAINAGELLIQAKDRSGGKFKPWLDKYCMVKPAQATRLIRLATHKEATRQAVRSGVASIDAIQRVIPKTKEASERTIADKNKMAYVGSKPSSERNSNDWHTPDVYVSMAREVLGTIDLDPFSSHQANRTVKATNILTENDDALNMPWPKGNTWMNPPFSGGMATKCVDKFLSENPGDAIVLMNASTDTKWFHRLAENATCFCLTAGRISFIDAGGKKMSGNTKGQVFFYFGNKKKLFTKVFSKIGLVA